MTPEQILQHLKEEHESYDPKWTGKSTFSESFLLDAIKYTIAITKNKQINQRGNHKNAPL